MNRNQMIENIRIACHCGERRAGEYLDAELCSLRELQLRNELRYVSIRFTTYFLEVFENIWDKIWRN